MATGEKDGEVSSAKYILNLEQKNDLFGMWKSQKLSCKNNLTHGNRPLRTHFIESSVEFRHVKTFQSNGENIWVWIGGKMNSNGFAL